MSFQRKGILSFSLFIGICTIVLLLLVSCLPAANYGTEEAASFATAVDVQPELPALQADEPQAEAAAVIASDAIPDVASDVVSSAALDVVSSTEPDTMPNSSPNFLPNANSGAELGAVREQNSNAGDTRFLPLAVDTKPAPLPLPRALMSLLFRQRTRASLRLKSAFRCSTTTV